MADSSRFPNYYSILKVDKKATPEQIREAYKKQSLISHPDRLRNPTPEERQAATERFQAVADAYYVLSDPTRRKEYDILLRSRAASSQSSEPSASNDFFSEFSKFFSGAAAGSGPSGTTNGKSSSASTEEKQQGPGVPPERPDADGVFMDVFEELLRPEVERRAPWWAWLGAASGAGIGYIIANFPGALVGGYAGNRLGAVRDAKGKPVAIVFSQLSGSAKAEILKALAVKVLGSI